MITQNNWVPISKALVKKLPTDRKLSEIEAMFSLTVNYDNNDPVSISGLASSWGWSRNRVSNFLNKLGINIVYKDKFNRHKKGQVAIQVEDRIGTGRGQVEFIDSKWLRKQKGRTGTGEGQDGDRRRSTIIKPNPKPEPNPKEKNRYGTFENVLLSDVEMKKLKERFNLTTEEKINTLSEYMKSKGKKYKSHYATLLAWARNDDKKNKQNAKGKPETTKARHARELMEDMERCQSSPLKQLGV